MTKIKERVEKLSDISHCPKCKSKNVANHLLAFCVPTDGSGSFRSISICLDCGYKDKRGNFEKTNQAIFREEKINQILNEL